MIGFYLQFEVRGVTTLSGTSWPGSYVEKLVVEAVWNTFNAI